MPSCIAFIYGIGTMTFSVWDYIFLDFRLGFKYFYVISYVFVQVSKISYICS